MYGEVRILKSRLHDIKPAARQAAASRRRSRLPHDRENKALLYCAYENISALGNVSVFDRYGDVFAEFVKPAHERIY